jgi:hypothetical protein
MHAGLTVVCQIGGLPVCQLRPASSNESGACVNCINKCPRLTCIISQSWSDSDDNSPRGRCPVAVARALIGHDSEAVHELYVSVGREALQKATAALPEI